MSAPLVSEEPGAFGVALDALDGLDDLGYGSFEFEEVLQGQHLKRQ